MFTVLVPLPTLVGEVYLLTGCHEQGTGGIPRWVVLAGQEPPLPLSPRSDNPAPQRWAWAHYR